MEDRMCIEVLLEESNTLVEILDIIVEDMSDPRLQAIADSAWYRLGSVNVLIRDQGGDAVAACLARGLIEQAAYWDWTLATGVGVDHLDRWAVLELENLSRLAAEMDDEVWLGWLVPPSLTLTVSSGPAIPKNPGDAVRRLGSGLDGAVLGPLQFEGLLSAYRILDVLAHGNYIGATILSGHPDSKLPDCLAAIATHLAAASATAVMFALVNEESCLDAVAAQFKLVATTASAIHGLKSQLSFVTRRLPHAKRTQPVDTTSSISRMPTATEDMTRLGIEFVDAADHLVQSVLNSANHTEYCWCMASTV